MSKGARHLLLKGGFGLMVLLATLFASAMGAGYLAAKGLVTEKQAVIGILGPFAAILMLLAYLFSIAWMRTIDEAAREAHKTAWYWGGTAGMAVAGVGIVLTALPDARTWVFDLGERTDPAYYMAAGALGTMFLMSLGYTLVWVGWWLSRSRA